MDLRSFHETPRTIQRNDKLTTDVKELNITMRKSSSSAPGFNGL